MDWYWEKGLHDAQITEKVVLDYNSAAMRGENYQNGLELKIDAAGAMFDTSVKALRFYNYKELTQDADITGCWWISDSLTKSDKKYILEIALMNKKQRIKYKIRFEACEVIRE